ncbi:Uncharacterised protein [Klebsiella pneumoniae]|nr:Uncharacterised protein [Klebsiella pneumoniae]
MRFTPGEAQIHFSARNGVQRIVIPLPQFHRRLWVALVHLLQQGIKADQHQRCFGGEHKLKPAWRAMVEFIEDLVANLHPVGQILFQTHRQRRGQ